VIATFFFMYIAGFTINMMTLMALSLVIGILIDDAVVVRENIYRHMEMGEDSVTAARNGTAQSGWPSWRRRSRFSRCFCRSAS
jgi:hydrophobic/amphiphilic exporter-1 (mainly G- bacteria), HAE1 family